MFYDWNAFWRGTITGILTFTTIHHGLSKMIPCKDDRQRWKQANVLTSFIHSAISTIICIYCVLENPTMLTTGMISSFTWNCYLFISFEMGYFIYDSLDLLSQPINRQTYEFLLHHGVILLCFGISVSSGQYIGYCVLSLFIEVNSIFLHFRQLILFWNISRANKIFTINRIFNLTTFIVFRFGIITYMYVWLINNHFNIPLVLSIIGQSGLIIMTIMNMYLFCRLIKSDFS